jgi:glycosyltransferase involved in cell wall biosynthesis
VLEGQRIQRASSRAVAPAEETEPVELTIVIPCLNEAETLARVIDRAQRFLHAYGLRGEVIVADNGSTDESIAIAIAAGADVIPIIERGYGAVLRGGIAAARGTFVAMGDADCSYDFMDLMPFLERLRAGTDLVVGNRFLGGIGKGAMPLLHRYLGNPLLSLAGRLFYSAPIGDFHCGLRAFRRQSVLALDLNSTGMEYASEMIVKAQLAGLSMEQVPARLVKDGRSRPPHLRSWRDGWRHLKFLLVFAPRWLFVYPGIALLIAGLAAFAVLLPGDVTIGGVRLGVHTLLFASSAMLIAIQLLSFGLLASLFGARECYWPITPRLARIRSWLTADNGCLLGGGMMAVGLIGAVSALGSWAAAGFSDMDPEKLMRVSIPSIVFAAMGLQIALTSFLIELLSQPARKFGE